MDLLGLDETSSGVSWCILNQTMQLGSSRPHVQSQVVQTYYTFQDIAKWILNKID
jgi:hypothetical protein